MSNLVLNVIAGTSSAIATDIGLLILRIASAAVFVAHGWDDIFDASVSNNVENYRDAGIPLPVLAAPFAAYIQLLGGILLLFGALTRLMSAGHIIVMAGALIFVHSGQSLVVGQDGSGSGFALIMCAASILLLLAGPGRFSLDRLLAARWSQSDGTGRQSSLA